VKGGIALEQRAKVDTVVSDKTGTLTYGEPCLADVVPMNGMAETDLLRTVASVESRSEHPLARAIVRAAGERGIQPPAPESFTTLPGLGVLGEVAGRPWAIGNRRLLDERGIALTEQTETRARALEAEGKTVFFVGDTSGVAGLVAVADAIRPEAQTALAELRSLGMKKHLLLTGDNERVAAAVATRSAWSTAPSCCRTTRSRQCGSFSKLAPW
jgi:P-type E1-E2 ATPase